MVTNIFILVCPAERLGTSDV